MTRNFVLAFAAVSCALAFGARQARAEREYEFGTKLAEDLGYFDLAEEQFKRVIDDRTLSSQQRLDGVLGIGSLKKKLAKNSQDAAEKAALYAEALKKFDEFLRTCDATHPQRSTAVMEKTEIQLDYAKAVAAKMDATADKAEKDKLLTEAERLFDEAIKPLKDAADAEQKRWEAVEDEIEKLPPDRPAPPQTVKRLEQTLNASVLARQRYINTMLDKTGIYPKDSDKLKKHVAALIEELKGQIDKYLAYDLVVLWFDLAAGRAYAQINDYKNACENGFDKVLAMDPGQIEDANMRRKVESYIHGLRKPAYYFKAKAAMEAGATDSTKYREVVSTVDLMLVDYRQALKEEIGKGAIMMKAEAYLKMKSYDDAMQAVAAILENVPPNDPWVNTVNQFRGPVIEEAAKAGVQLKRDPAVLRSAAVGLYQQQKFEEAVRAYREAIAAARDSDFPPFDRLKLEPDCWFGMGLSYYRIGLLYEAALAFETVIQNFAPHVLGEKFVQEGRSDCVKLLEDIKKKVASGEIKSEVEGATPNAYAELYKELSKRPPYKDFLPEVSDKVKKSADNFRLVIGKRRNETQSAADRALYLYALEVIVSFDPAMAADRDYFLSSAIYDEGDSQLKDSAGLLESDAPVAAEKLREAMETLQKAIDGFGKVKETSRLYEVALYKIANTNYRIVTALDASKKRITTIKPAEIQDYAKRTLAAYDKYLAFIGRVKAIDQETQKQRERYSADIQLARPLVHLVLGDPDTAIKGCEAFLADKNRNKEYDSLMLWTTFKAYREKALSKDAPFEVVDPSIKKMVELAQTMEKHEQAGKFYKTAGQYIAATYGTAANGLIALRKKMMDVDAQKVAEAERPAFLKKLADIEEAVKRYRGESAVWITRTMGEKPSAEELGNVGNTFFMLDRYEEAMQAFARLLKDYDPEGDKKGREISEAELADMRSKIYYDDENKLARARKDFDKMTDFIFDKEESKTLPPEQRKEELQDYGKAVDIIDAMAGDKGYAKDVQIAKELQSLRQELQTRLMFLTATQKVSQCYAKLARETAAAGDPEKSLEYWQKARDEFRALLNYWYTDVDIKLGLAESLAALGKKDPASYKEAMQVYLDLKDKVLEKSEKWFQANKSLSEVFLAMGEAQKALGYPVILRETMPDYAKTNWPDMDDFIKLCVEKGAKLTDGKDVTVKGNAVYGDFDEVEREYQNLLSNAKYGLDQKTISQAEYESRLKQAEKFKADMLKQRARANERDAVTTAYKEMMDKALYAEKEERNAAKAAKMRKEAEDWRKEEMNKLDAKWKAEDDKAKGSKK